MIVLFSKFLLSDRLIFIIGAGHLILLGFGIYYTIMDLIQDQQPVDIDDITLMVFLTLFQILIIVLLIIGTKKKKTFLILPWVVCVCAILTPFSILTFWYAAQEEILIFIFNIGVAGIYWTMWYIVYTFYKQLTNVVQVEEIHRIQEKN